MDPEELREQAEAQVAELLRGEDAKEFDLRVSVRKGHWFVSLGSPDVKGPPSEGEGKTFAEAWHDIKPWWFDAPPPARER
jgi:hypothetical protein